MKVKFLDLKAQYETISAEIEQAIREVLDSSAFSGGPFVESFEASFARYCGCRHAVGLGSGTDALWLSLLAMGIGSGDEVITVPNTFFATAEAISLTGARPVLVDVDERTYTMDPALLESRITGQTRAIIPVHLFGQMADMDPLMDIARRHGLKVIEDACQAHGAEYHGRRAGSIGDVGVFSFYPGKNLGAYGEAGAVVTDDEEIYQKLRLLRDHGQRRKHDHQLVGCNARMDGLQGAVLSVKLRHLDRWNSARRQRASWYKELLGGAQGLILPQESSGRQHIYHIYCVRLDDRERVLAELEKQDIGCAVHYPVPIHLQKAYAGLGYRAGSFPVSEQCAGQSLSLPMYAELDSSQVQQVAERLKGCLTRRLVMTAT